MCPIWGTKHSPPQVGYNMLWFGRKLEFFENFEYPHFFSMFFIDWGKGANQKCWEKIAEIYEKHGKIDGKS